MPFKKHFFLFSFFTLFLAACSANAAQREGKPNLILILTDDQAAHSLNYMPVVRRELAQNGITFTSAYVTTPLCCPSRASILTGLYVRNHGVLTNRFPTGGASKFQDENTLPVWLKQAGYKTALLGKYLNEYDNLPKGYIPPGWDEWQAFYTTSPGNYFFTNYTVNENGRIKEYSASEENFSTDVLTQKAVAFIEQNADEPFFLSVNYVAPHQPYYSARRHADLFKSYDENFQPYAPPNYFEKNISDKPQWLSVVKTPTPDRVEGIYQRQLRSLITVDEGVGQIVQALSENNIRDNTVIIFTSDNGYSLGNHGFVGKACPYTECLQIPFVVSYPAQIKTPRVDDRFVLNIDIAPTFAEFAGAQNLPQMDGKSFAALLLNPLAEWRDGFFFEQFEDDQDDGGATSIIPPYTGFRTKEWSLTLYESGEVELYDLMRDPYQMQNLAAQPEYAEIIEMLKRRMQAEME